MQKLFEERCLLYFDTVSCFHPFSLIKSCKFLVFSCFFCDVCVDLRGDWSTRQLLRFRMSGIRFQLQIQATLQVARFFEKRYASHGTTRKKTLSACLHEIGSEKCPGKTIVKGHVLQRRHKFLRARKTFRTSRENTCNYIRVSGSYCILHQQTKQVRVKFIWIFPSDRGEHRLVSFHGTKSC